MSILKIIQAILIGMRKILLTIFSATFVFVGTLNACPLEEEEQNKILSELCTMDDGDWSSNRLNEMIILLKFGKLPPEKSHKSNRILASLTCNFITQR